MAGAPSQTEQPCLTLYSASYKWRGTDGNIPAFPVIIITPVNLHIQMDLEIQRFIVPHFFDVLPYTGLHDTRIKYWDNVWAQSKQTGANRILLATTNVS